MIKIDENLLISDLLTTARELSSKKNNDFIKNNYGGFMVLNESLFNNYDKIVYFDNTLNKDSYEKLLLKDNMNSLIKMGYYLYNNKDYYIDMADNYLNIFRSVGFSTYPFWGNIRSYSEKDFKDIILGFYSTLGNDYYKIVKKYFDEKRIHIGEITYDYNVYSGCFKQLQWLESGYIFSVYDDFNSLTAEVLVHELGHAIDAERFLFPQQKNIPTFSDFLVEVPSTTFEIGFHDYLVDNRIDIDGGRILGNVNTFYTFDNLDSLALILLELENMYLDSDGIAVDESGEEYDVRNFLIYGIGGIFAMHLNLIRKSSNKDFLKAFNNLITCRKEMTFEQSIESIGFSVEDFVSCKYIEPKIKNDVLELRKRYKY